MVGNPKEGTAEAALRSRTNFVAIHLSAQLGHAITRTAESDSPMGHPPRDLMDAGEAHQGEEWRRESACQHFDISDYNSSSSSDAWASPFHFGSAVEDSPSLAEAYAFGPSWTRQFEARQFEITIPRDEVRVEVALADINCMD